MVKKRVFIISIITLILTAIGLGLFFFLTVEDEKSSLSVLDRQWIESNKNKVIDLSIINNVPIFTQDGEGVVFEFIDSLEKNTGLEFNKLSYSRDDENNSSYSVLLTSELEKKDIIVNEDNYVIAGKESVKYNNLDEVPEMTIGIMSDDLEMANYYLKNNSNIKYKSFTKESEMMSAIGDSIDGIIVPKTLYLEKIVKNEDLNINFNISDMKQYLVLRLGKTKKLNSIISKYYKKWKKDNYDEFYNKYFTNNYFEFSEIYKQDRTKFSGKTYKYGFVANIPYDKIVNEKLVGVNRNILKSFSNIADIDVSFKEYKNYSSLIKDFNAGNVDLFLNTSTYSKYESDNIKTVSVYDEKGVVLVNESNNVVVNSLSSIKGFTVKTIKGSLVNKSIGNNNITSKTYSSLNSILKNINKNDIIVIDYNTYLMYRNSDLKNYIPSYIYNIDSDYNFVLRDVNSNEIFNKYFNFYLSFINEKEYMNGVRSNDFKVVVSNRFIRYSLISILIILLVTFGFRIFKTLKPKKKIVNISKEEKLRYIDMLTSLKNRNYLNDYMEKWDSSEIYPQSIVIVDLNNVAYINDNYGHEEGDKVIKSAANILINTQMENTEIVRTNGNEFLIYLVEYDEKQILTYIRKLNKEFKDLEHGFGAAIGYSMITDGIKTLDDAINEATLDMRNNKEEN